MSGGGNVVRLRRGMWLIAIVVVLVVAGTVSLSVALTSNPGHPGAAGAGSALALRNGGASPEHPNIVYILTDDLSWNLVQYMPHVVALERAGMTFTNFTVTDSLCCPSRASILTGNFPHDTRVFNNSAPNGGFDAFTTRQEDTSTFATSLHAVGYHTALIGKYLNQYRPQQGYRVAGHLQTAPYVPPGWTDWGGVDGGGYREYGYTMANDRSVHSYGRQAADYLTTVAQHRAIGFVDASTRARRPFLLEIATFAPHAPYVPAPADVGTFPNLRVPHTPAFGHKPTDAPPWLRKVPPLTRPVITLLDTSFERRVEAVQSVDRMIGALEQRLSRLGDLKNTVFVFNSDNGYHMGDYGLRAGKMTAFDTDVRVPLIVAGPGIPAGVVNRNVVENIDLRPTFDQLAGARTPATVDGHSLVALLHHHPVPWRTYALIEHRHPPYDPSDPDHQTLLAADPPSYNALRTAQWTYVSYSDGSHEFYNRMRDPYELHNVYASLSAARKAALQRRLNLMTQCHGAAQCWAAAVPTPGAPAPGAPAPGAPAPG